jgi:hypothetical protein
MTVLTKHRYALASATSAALLALTLAGCAPASPSTGTDTSTDDTSTSDDSSTDATTGDAYTDDTSDGTLVTLGGSGDYTVGVTAPIGSYELDGKPDTQPAGCTWALEDADGNIQFQDQGTFLFITEENKFFQTSGCPDWVQYE